MLKQEARNKLRSLTGHLDRTPPAKGIAKEKEKWSLLARFPSLFSDFGEKFGGLCQAFRHSKICVNCPMTIKKAKKHVPMNCFYGKDGLAGIGNITEANRQWQHRHDAETYNIVRSKIKSFRVRLAKAFKKYVADTE